MKVRRIVVGVAFGVVAVLGVGVGVASGQSPDGEIPSWAWRDMQAMHDSPARERMHEQMGPRLAAQCEEIHAQMQDLGGMMGGQGMMGG